MPGRRHGEGVWWVAAAERWDDTAAGACARTLWVQSESWEPVVRQRSFGERVLDRLRLLRADLPARSRHLSLRHDLVLISQVARSGGTLLNQLLDRHPQLLVHPFELELGATRSVWPEFADLELQDRSRVRGSLYEASIDDFIMGGLSPHKQGSTNETRYPFRFSRYAYRKAFDREWQRRGPTTQRDAIDVYFSAFWTAWADGPSVVDDVRWLVGFRPGTIGDAASMQRLHRDYPTGRVVTLVRDPVTWFVSARRHKDRYADIRRAADIWIDHTRAAIALKRARPESVLVGSFEQLVGSTPAFMENLAAWLGIDWDPILLDPTMAGRPMKADSSFEIGEFGVRRETIDRQHELSATDRAWILERCGDIHDEARSMMAVTS
jgi:hypothetical protein